MLDLVHFQGEKGPLYRDTCRSFLYRCRVRAYVEKLFHIYLRKTAKTCRRIFVPERFFWGGRIMEERKLKGKRDDLEAGQGHRLS